MNHNPKVEKAFYLLKNINCQSEDRRHAFRDNLEALEIYHMWYSKLYRVTVTLRCMNFCSGSYHNSSTRPEGTAAHKNVLSVYGLRADEEKSRKHGFRYFSILTNNRRSAKTFISIKWINIALLWCRNWPSPTLHFRHPLVSAIFTDTANFLWKDYFEFQMNNI